MNRKTEIQHVLNNGSILIYGAHLVAIELYRYLKALNIKFQFAGFVVTDMEGNPEVLEQKDVLEIADYQADKNVTVMIAMPEKYHDEAEAYARGLGFSTFIRIGQREMSILKGRQLLYDYKKYGLSCFDLYEDPNDASWLNMTDSLQSCQSVQVQREPLAERHYKFPTLYYLSSEIVFHIAKKFDFYGDYERVLGTYRNLHAFPFQSTPDMNYEKTDKQPLHIYMVFSQWDSSSIAKTEYPQWICPIQAGSILTEKKSGEFLDETGDSISEKNNILAEMTAAYWIWKNAAPVKYKGLCHYRRHFIITEEEVMTLEANGFDVVLTTPRYAPGGIQNMFLKETPVREPVYRTMLRAIGECHPEDKDGFEKYMEESLYYPNNMVIARSAVYDTYCEWVFPVLFRMMEIEREDGYGHEKDRHIAYAAEVLTSFYFSEHKKDYCIAITDYQLYV